MQGLKSFVCWDHEGTHKCAFHIKLLRILGFCFVLFLFSFVLFLFLFLFLRFFFVCFCFCLFVCLFVLVWVFFEPVTLAMIKR